MDGGRGVCRDCEVGEARGDETIGRFVLIVSDMSDSVGWIVEVGMGVQCGREKNLGVFDGQRTR